MAKKLEEFTTKTPATGDYIYLTRPGDKAAANDVRDEGKTAAELVARVANPRGFIAARVDSKELTSSSLTTNGWYTIAETEGVGSLRPSALFHIAMQGGDHGNISFKIGCASSGSAKTKLNTTVEITSRGSTLVTGASVIDGVRLAKSDSVSASGFKVQVNINATVILYIQKSNNLDRATEEGFFLVDPYLDDTPTLPDGVTAGTFLEAGEELSFAKSNTFYGDWHGFSNSNDLCFCLVEWPEIPKQGTGLVITLPSTTLFARDGQANSATISGAHTISNFSIDGRHVHFTINEVGVFAGLNNSAIHFLISGTGCKLTIT